MKSIPTPPRTYQSFIRRYPRLKEAWECIAEAGSEGPLEEKTIRLIKLAIAVGSLKEGAVRSNARKALASGISRQEIEQVISLAAGTIGLPSTVAVYSWIRNAFKKNQGKKI